MTTPADISSPSTRFSTVSARLGRALTQLRHASRLAAASAILIACSVGLAGTWTRLANLPPASVGTMLLLSDGTVIAAKYNGGTIQRGWYRLTPDGQGSYANGTWSTISPMISTRLFFASQVLKDGRVFVAGGEYGTGTAKSEIYDPTTNVWSQLLIPTTLLNPTQPSAPYPTSPQAISDAMSEILPNGNVLITPVYPATLRQSIIYNPTTNAWSAGPAHHSNTGNQVEATWVKLPDNSILTIDPHGRQSERYIPSSNTWVLDGTVPVDLYDTVGGELGAAFLLPNGRAFFLGSSGNTALYIPTGTATPGTWIAGPVIPNGLTTPDAPAAMMTTGNVLCAVSPPITTDASGNLVFPTPTTFYEYDSVANSFTSIMGPVGPSDDNPSFVGSMLALPDGGILFSHDSTDLFIYHPSGAPLAAGKPTISNITRNADGSFHLTGTRLNGISEGACYGDDAQMNTNYPIVRVSNGSGNLYYARSYNWSSTGVMTGNQVVTTEYKLPSNTPPGRYWVEAVANGNPSDPYLPASFFPCVQQWVPGSIADLNGPARASMMWDPDGTGPLPSRLVVVGDFSMAGSSAASNIAVWNGLSWSALGSGTDGPINSVIAMLNGDLIVGGDFTMAGGVPANRVARWRIASGTWSALGSGLTGPFNGHLSVNALAVLPTGMLIVGGSFTTAGNAPAINIARWDGTDWFALTSATTNGTVDAFALLPNSDLIVGGGFTLIGGAAGSHVVRWDGVTWWPMYPGLNGGVNTLKLYPDGTVLAGGSFTASGSTPAASVAVWDGTVWSGLGLGLNPGQYNRVNSVAILPDGRVAAAGKFSASGSSLMANIAMWDGATWFPLEAGATAAVNTLTVLPSGDLFVGGDFTSAGGTPSGYLARWANSMAPTILLNPQSLLSAPGATAMLSSTPAIAYNNVSFQWRRNGVNVANGAGGASVGGGTVSGASGALASPTNGSPTVLTITGARPSDAGQYTVVFTNSCGSVTSSAAALSVRCLGDFNADGHLAVQDIFDFLSAWFASSPSADFNGGGLSVQDIFDFLNAWFAGC